MTVRSDINVRRTDEFNHFFRTNEAVVEDHLRLHSDFLRQSLQIRAIVIAFTAENVRMGSACDHVDDILVLRQDVRQCLNNVFNSLIRREQAEGEEYRFSFHTKAFFVEVRIQEWQVGNAMRHHVDLAAGHFEYFLQELGRQLAHDDEAVR